MSRAVMLITAVALLAVVGFSGAASGKNPRGSPKWCKHHPKTTLSACQGSGTGSPPTTNITVSPNPVVETGGSDVYAVISVTTDPVYAEQTVDVISPLANRCGGGVLWLTSQGSSSGSTASGTLDDDGNATFTVLGASCAAGTVQVIADVEAGSHPTYTATLTIEPPTPSV